MLHIVLSTDSLALPRVWDRSQPTVAPEQDFRFGMTYPALLRGRLNRMFPFRTVTVSVLAQRSATIATAALRAYELTVLMEPTVLVLHYGIVDCWLRSENPDLFRCPLEEFVRHLNHIQNVRDKCAPNLAIIFIGIMQPPKYILDRAPRQSIIISQYNNALRNNIRSGSFIIDLERAYRGNCERLIHFDGFHLSREGHKVVARRLALRINDTIQTIR